MCDVTNYVCDIYIIYILKLIIYILYIYVLKLNNNLIL